MTNKIEVDRSGNRIYYDITVKFNETVEGFVEYSEVRQDPLIFNPEEYYLAIDRFQIPTSSIPLFKFNSTMPYNVTLVYDNGAGTRIPYTESISYITDNALPFNSDPNNSYWHVFSYRQLVKMWNNAYATAFTALKTAHPGVSQTSAPYFVYDSVSELFSLIVSYDYRDSVSEIQIYSNWDTHARFFDGYRTFYEGATALQTDLAFRFIIEDTEFNAYAKSGTSITVPPAFLKFDQEYRVLDRMNSFDSIVISTKSIPTVKEFISSKGLNEGSTNFTGIMMDFEPLLISAGDERQTMAYFAENNYKLIDMPSNTPLRNFDFQIKWQDNTGFINNLFLEPEQKLSIKFVFIRKDSFRGG